MHCYCGSEQHPDYAGKEQSIVQYPHGRNEKYKLQASGYCKRFICCAVIELKSAKVEVGKGCKLLLLESLHLAYKPLSVMCPTRSLLNATVMTQQRKTTKNSEGEQEKEGKRIGHESTGDMKTEERRTGEVSRGE